ASYLISVFNLSSLALYVYPSYLMKLPVMRRSDQLYFEFSFTLPKGLIDDQNRLHRKGSMRLATAKDEIYVQSQSSVQNNSAYGFLVMLSQVISRLGNLTSMTPATLERLTLRDIAYLREFYNRINEQGEAHIPAECPHCQAQFAVELNLSGES
ncbi:MAG TPA: hypothetical protein V6C65_20200, partial [Allocoleopsis sp.]